MAYPPSTIATGKTDATSTAGDHAPHHNTLAQAINDTVATLGTNPKGTAADLTARLAALDPTVLYDKSPGVTKYTNQEAVRIIGSGGANPVQGTFTPSTANPRLTVSMLAEVYGGALVDVYLVIGVRAGNDATVPIAKPDPVLGTPIAATGVTGFQVYYLPALGWEQVSVSFMVDIVFGSSRTNTGGTLAALTPGSTYIWQICATTQSGATSINVGTNPVTPGISPDYKTVWVPNFGSNTVTPVSLGARPLWILNGGMKDVLGNPMSWSPVPGTAITVGTGPYQCRVSPDGTYVAVANNTAKTVTIINASTKAVVGTSAAMAGIPGIKSLAWSSDSVVVWAALSNGTIAPITASTATLGTPVTVAAAHNLFMASNGTVGWVLDLTTAQVFPLSGMTGSAATVGGAIALASVGDNLAMNPVDNSLWVHRTSNNSLVRITTAGVQSTTVLTTAITNCTGMAVHPNGSAIWLCDYNAAILGFDTVALAQSYYTSSAPVAGAYGVVLSDIDDICVTRYNGNQMRVWPGSYMVCDQATGWPPNQGVAVTAQGVTVP